MAYTKGPWVKSKHGRLEGANGKDIAVSELSITIQHYESSEGIANANMIIATTDMYEALRQARHLFEDDESISAVIEAALLKAEGE